MKATARCNVAPERLARMPIAFLRAQQALPFHARLGLPEDLPGDRVRS